MYYALIGDIISSKKLSQPRRAEAQERLSAALRQVNGAYSGGIAARFLITLGDECQGLMLATGDPVSAALDIIHAMRPYEIRFAIGFGGMDTPIDPGAAIGADGAAFHRARACVEAMKTRHFARLRFSTGNAELDGAANTVAALCDRLYLNFTDKQEQLVYTMLKARISGEKLTQAELGEIAGVGQSTVNSQLSAAGFNEYAAGVMFVRGLVSRAKEGAE